MPDTPRTATPAEVTALVGYLEHQLTIPECARQSGLSQREMTELLGRHDITRRPGDTGTPQAAAAESSLPPPSSPGQLPHPARTTAAAPSGLPGHDDLLAAPQAASRTSGTGRHMTTGARPARTVTRSALPPAPAHQAAAGPALAQVRFLTIAEVAVIMRVSKMTVYRLVHDGELDAVRVGRSFRIPEQAVTSYLRGAYMTQDRHEP